MTFHDISTPLFRHFDRPRGAACPERRRRGEIFGIISVTMGLRPAAARIADAVNSPQRHPGWSDLPRTAIRGADVRGPEPPGTPALSDVEGASPCGSGPRIGVRGGNVGGLRTSTNERPLQFPPASSRRRREIRHGIVKHINPKSFQRGASDRGAAREGYRRSAAHRSAPARSGPLRSIWRIGDGAANGPDAKNTMDRPVFLFGAGRKVAEICGLRGLEIERS